MFWQQGEGTCYAWGYNGKQGQEEVMPSAYTKNNRALNGGCASILKTRKPWLPAY